MMRFKLSILQILVCAVIARGQSINIDFGNSFGTPSSTYAAAGEPGFWNALDGLPGPRALVGLDGFPIAATASFGPTTPMLSFNHPQTAGGNEQLLDDAIGGWGDVVGTITFDNLELGAYEICTYAWIPQYPDNRVLVWPDEVLTTQFQIIGGAWVGPGPTAGVTHSIHQVQVDDPRETVNVVGGIFGHDWWLNGVQLVRLGAAFGDMDCDQVVSTGDIPAFVQALLDPSAYAASYPGCDIRLGDFDGDGATNGNDVAAFVSVVIGT